MPLFYVFGCFFLNTLTYIGNLGLINSRADRQSSYLQVNNRHEFTGLVMVLKIITEVS